MNKAIELCRAASAWSPVVCLGLLGCAANNPPMVFGDTTTFGIQIGSQTAAGGASVSLGYKAQSVALVPVTYNDDDGVAKTLKGQGKDKGSHDSLSVFASFESATGQGRAASAVGLGQVFSTGLAAQQITQGYVCRAQGRSCEDVEQSIKDATRDANEAARNANLAAHSANGAVNEIGKAIAAGAVVVSSKPSAPKDVRTATSLYHPDDGPYQRPLVFLRTDVLGIDIGGSLAERGLQFVLGYHNRNLALVPVYAFGADGQGGRISSGIGSGQLTDKDTTPRDGLSVLGQFRTSTETSQLGYELERFFATGVAARNLSQAIGITIAKTPPPAASAASGVK